MATADGDWTGMGSGAPGLRPRWLREHPEVLDLVSTWPEERVRRELDRLLERWDCLDLTTTIRWCWNPRLRTTAGRAVFFDMLIELNPLLLARHPEEVPHLLAHEAAHLVVQRLHGRQPPHGAIWKQYMRAVGESTRASHQLDVAGLRRASTRRNRRRGAAAQIRRWLRRR